ncbi:efflux RND transporter periplasmic adaptor subunit [Shewanella abyssi]|uniref:efflux RND transporter periplasmic adaptor subunit n=1 Tax=Shewanella abyssi TaxID=311789 RepID=UPI00200E9086|nr:efflux RND transporter periplasmic adaptor subunit [Shewanella abyssi]MCL1051593.1 efflux RND transporter periplasmic adaptor subunit [Shewanella abyssi]
MKNCYSLTLIAVGISTVLLSGCTEPQASPDAAKPLPSVETISLSTTAITPYFDFIGRTVAVSDVDIIPRVGGELVAVHFKDGDLVEKGDLLYQIDPRVYQAKLTSAEATLAMAKANVVMASSNEKRAKKLIKDKSISEMQYDTAIADYATALALVTEAKAAVTSAELELGFCYIYAPLSGRAGFSAYRVGDRVTIAVKNRLVSIAQVDPIHFNFDIDEKLYRRIRSGVDKATAKNQLVDPDLTLQLSDNSIYPEKGEIYAVGNRINPDSGSINIQASFNNDDYSLIPGEHGMLNVKFSNQTINGVLVPLSALQQNQAGDFVMVVDKEMVVTPRYIELGQRYGINQHVIEGLQAGERIVVKGLQKIRAGVTVNDIAQAN